MKAHKCLSPTKQNMSPIRQQKQVDIITELLSLIKSSGIKLPASLQKSIPPQLLSSSSSTSTSSLLKLNANPAQDQPQLQTLQKLKVKLGDTEFELKKIEEDFAQYKLDARLEKEKEIKKWEDAYNILRTNLDFSNEDSSLKLIKLRQNHQKEIQTLKDKHEAELRQQKQKLIKTYQERLSSMKKIHDRQVKQAKQKSFNQMQSTKNKHENQIKQLKQNQQSEIRKLCLKHKQILDNKDKQFDSIYVALQSQKKTQQKLHQKTKIQSSQTKQKLYTELYYQRNLKKDLQQTIQKKQSQIKAFKSQIHDLQVQLILSKQKHQKRQKQLKEQFEKQKIGIEQLNRENLTKLLSEHGKELEKYEKSVQQISQWKENKQTLMMERYEEVQFKFDQRPSRQEDLDMIQRLKVKLLRKQQQLRVLSKQFKNCVLQSQNKQETYNRIFTSNTMNKFEKKCLAKDREQFKSKDSLCRKSQTTDIKFLLKVYNKHL